jgi:hypothetical protein
MERTLEKAIDQLTKLKESFERLDGEELREAKRKLESLQKDLENNHSEQEKANAAIRREEQALKEKLRQSAENKFRQTGVNGKRFESTESWYQEAFKQVSMQGQIKYLTDEMEKKVAPQRRRCEELQREAQEKEKAIKGLPRLPLGLGRDLETLAKELEEFCDHKLEDLSLVTEGEKACLGETRAIAQLIEETARGIVEKMERAEKALGTTSEREDIDAIKGREEEIGIILDEIGLLKKLRNKELSAIKRERKRIIKEEERQKVTVQEVVTNKIDIEGYAEVVIDTSFIIDIYEESRARGIDARAIVPPAWFAQIKLIVVDAVEKEVQSHIERRNGKMSTEFWEAFKRNWDPRSESVRIKKDEAHEFFGIWKETKKGKKEIEEKGEWVAHEYFLTTADLAIASYVARSGKPLLVLAWDDDIRYLTNEVKKDHRIGLLTSKNLSFARKVRVAG